MELQVWSFPLVNTIFILESRLALWNLYLFISAVLYVSFFKNSEYAGNIWRRKQISYSLSHFAKSLVDFWSKHTCPWFFFPFIYIYRRGRGNEGVRETNICCLLCSFQIGKESLWLSSCHFISYWISSNHSSLIHGWYRNIAACIGIIGQTWA